MHQRRHHSKYIVPLGLLAALSVGCEESTSIRVGPSAVVDVDVANRAPVEAHLAIHPNDLNHLLGAAMMSAITADTPEMLSRLSCGSFVSRDDGRTWDDHEFPVSRCFDPYVTILPNGRAIFSAFVGPASALVVFTSEDGGITWSEVPDTFGLRHDRPTSTIARGRGSPDGILYLVSSQYVGDTPRRRVVYVARSADGGRAFEPPVHLEPSPLDHFAEGAVVLPDDTLVVAYTESTDSAGDYLPRRRAWVLRSFDGGSTFTQPEFVTDACGPPYRLSWLAADLSDGPFKNRLYFVCNLPGESGVVVTHSTADGGSWSDPVQVHASPADTLVLRKVMAIAVSGAGVVSVAWVDARHAPPDRECYDVYFAASLDGGESFLPDQRVTESTSCPSEAANGAIGRIFVQSGGDYIGMVADPDGRFRLFWSDARDEKFHLRTGWVAVVGDVRSPN
jgi:hypothetical protein